MLERKDEVKERGNNEAMEEEDRRIGRSWENGKNVGVRKNSKMM